MRPEGGDRRGRLKSAAHSERSEESIGVFAARMGSVYPDGSFAVLRMTIDEMLVAALDLKSGRSLGCARRGKGG